MFRNLLAGDGCYVPKLRGSGAVDPVSSHGKFRMICEAATSLAHPPPYISDLAPSDYFLFRFQEMNVLQ